MIAFQKPMESQGRVRVKAASMAHSTAMIPPWESIQTMPESRAAIVAAFSARKTSRRRVIVAAIRSVSGTSLKLACSRSVGASPVLAMKTPPRISIPEASFGAIVSQVQ